MLSQDDHPCPYVLLVPMDIIEIGDLDLYPLICARMAVRAASGAVQETGRGNTAWILLWHMYCSGWRYNMDTAVIT